jgi:hypothetical protein
MKQATSGRRLGAFFALANHRALFARRWWCTWSRYATVPLRVLMTHTCSVVSVTLVAALLCTGAYPVAYAADPLPAYAQGQPAYDPGQYNPSLNTPPQGMPGVGLAVPAKPTGPAPDAADPGLAGNLNLSMPDVTFRNLLTKLQAPAQTAADSLSQNTTPDTTSSYTASQPPPDPAQHGLAAPTKFP